MATPKTAIHLTLSFPDGSQLVVNAENPTITRVAAEQVLAKIQEVAATPAPAPVAAANLSPVTLTLVAEAQSVKAAKVKAPKAEKAPKAAANPGKLLAPTSEGACGCKRGQGRPPKVCATCGKIVLPKNKLTGPVAAAIPAVEEAPAEEPAPVATNVVATPAPTPAPTVVEVPAAKVFAAAAPSTPEVAALAAQVPAPADGLPF